MPHIHEKVDFTTSVFIVHGNTVLLRLHDKYGIWLGVGGHVELHEDPTEAAIREVMEEVGLEVTLAGELPVGMLERPTFGNLIPPAYMNRHKVSETHEHVDMVYFALAETNETNEPEEEKSQGLLWATLEDLDSLDLKPHIRLYATEALKRLSA